MTLATLFLGTGRRKTSIARVRLEPGSGKRTVNGVDLDRYFSRITLSRQAIGPLAVSNTIEKFDLHATVHGGGHAGQAGAISLANRPKICPSASATNQSWRISEARTEYVPIRRPPLAGLEGPNARGYQARAGRVNRLRAHRVGPGRGPGPSRWR